MDMLIRAAGLGLLAVLLGSVLKKENPAMALLAAVAAVCVILALAADAVASAVKAAEKLCAELSDFAKKIIR